MASVPTSSLSTEQKDELLCTYATLILYDDNVDITSENIVKLIKASNNTVEPYVPMLFARALKGKDIGSLLFAAGSASGGGGVAPAAGGGGEAAAAPEAAAPAKEEEKEEEEEEDDMGFSLFD